jgi:hypothetical protein
MTTQEIKELEKIAGIDSRVRNMGIIRNAQRMIKKLNALKVRTSSDIQLTYYYESIIEDEYKKPVAI